MARAKRTDDLPEPTLPPARKTVPCNHVHVTKGACTLDFGHKCDHVWENPDADEIPANSRDHYEPRG